MIKIGDLARVSQVSVSTIRYYDEVGLLKPISVDAQSGYRYYSVAQLPRLNRILALKYLGFTLPQIENMLNSGITLDQLRGMLRLKHAEIEQQVAAEQVRLDRITARLKQIEQEDCMFEFDVAMKTVSPILAATSTVTIPTNGQVPYYLGRAYKAVYDHIQANGAKATGACLALWHQGAEVLENEVAEAAVPIDRVIPATDTVKVYELPPIEVATVVNHGDFNDLPRMHTALLQWMEANQYERAGPYREVYHEDRDKASTVTEVQYPVTKI